jgi:anti-anti-sigma factor
MDLLQPQSFSIHALPREGPVVRVRVTGAVDLRTAPELERALARALEPAVGLRLDLSAVWFIDSTGVRAIAAAAQKARSSGGTLTLDSPLPHQARRIIEITGLQRLLQLQ